MNPQTDQAVRFLEDCRRQTDALLEQKLADARPASSRLLEAMRYSVLGGGKRIRPALCLGAAEAVGGDPLSALVPACAVELIHAYSLIHDDLPAMDDDGLRRGHPTTHIAFGEATAILAGDALQSLAFGWLSRALALDPETRLSMVTELAAASGYQGMAGGQAIDLESVDQPPDLNLLETMHRHKTGALIEASVRMGAMTNPDLDDRQMQGLTRYAKALGLAFQVQDDLLDIEGDTSVIGKPRGSDLARNKPTYPALMGVGGARAYLDELLNTALDSLQGFDHRADKLRAMASFVVARDH
ncbi:MAG: farnesyl diphosphate synthase [Pseudomonadota bacterium]|nr:farnesyl diphosphate synthase [Pseudomonadota bacterium]